MKKILIFIWNIVSYLPKKLFGFLKAKWGKLSPLVRFTIVLEMLGVCAFAILYSTLEAFAIFGESIVYTATFIFIFFLFDNYVLKDIDTIEELKKRNVAYAIFLCAIALVFIAIAILVG